jgi:hypothetical protein
VSYPHVVRIYRAGDPDGEPVQDTDGLILEDAPGAELVVEGRADVQDGMRRRASSEFGPMEVERDADCFLEFEELGLEVELGDTVAVEWEPEKASGRKSTGTVVGVRELDGRLFLDWLSRDFQGDG